MPDPVVPPSHHKLIIYQLFVRLFGNRKTRNKYYGSLKENGCGKFNDITREALESLKAFGISHIWYTGVPEHATLTDYSAYGIARDHPMVVKGKAGSPYAIKDYYDVDPDLAENVTQRMYEFEALVHRTHAAGMKVLIDFVPNHVSRQYGSDQKPEGVRDFGEDDDKTTRFAPDNNFYYIPGESFLVPEGIREPVAPTSEYTEFPARATGNDVFSARPSVYDWFETVKLNYGVDYLDHRRTYFDPIPDTWLKMRDILLFWAGKGVDGFRCDMAEMVPVPFWAWVINEVRDRYPGLLFIAEIYNPSEYGNYIFNGKFDYLYDKVGLYDALRRLVEGHGNAGEITEVWQRESGNFSGRMLRFLENHDEQRIASRYFAGNPFDALPAMALAATLHDGPVMIYSGQEVGVAARTAEGYQGDDGRTSIFDYWGVPELQAWVNRGKFDGGGLTHDQRRLREFYMRLNHLVTSEEAFYKGAFYDLQYLNNQGQSEGYDASKLYSFLRYTENRKILAVFNFDQSRTFAFRLRIPARVWSDVTGLTVSDGFVLHDIFNPDSSPEGIPFGHFPDEGIPLKPGPLNFYLFEIRPT